MKLLNYALAPIALALALPGVAMAHDAQSGPVVAAGHTFLTISADGRTSRVPDLAVFSAGVVSQGKTASQALSANSADMSRVIAALAIALWLILNLRRPPPQDHD